MPTKPTDKIIFSVQEIENQSFDTDLNTKVNQPLAYDGVNLQRKNADNLATKIQTSGTDTFIGIAAPGTAQGTAKWQAQKIDTNGNITWADGDANFDNVATDLTSLTYS